MHDGLIPVVETLKDMGYDGVEMPLFNPNKELYADWGKSSKPLAWKELQSPFVVQRIIQLALTPVFELQQLMQ